MGLPARDGVSMQVLDALYYLCLLCYVVAFVIVLIKLLQLQKAFPKCKHLSHIPQGPHSQASCNTAANLEATEPFQTMSCYLETLNNT